MFVVSVLSIIFNWSSISSFFFFSHFIIMIIFIANAQNHIHRFAIYKIIFIYTKKLKSNCKWTTKKLPAAKKLNAPTFFRYTIVSYPILLCLNSFRSSHASQLPFRSIGKPPENTGDCLKALATFETDFKAAPRSTEPNRSPPISNPCTSENTKHFVIEKLILLGRTRFRLRNFLPSIPRLSHGGSGNLSIDVDHASFNF